METELPVHVITMRIRQRMDDLRLNPNSLADKLGRRSAFITDLVGAQDEKGGRRNYRREVEGKKYSLTLPGSLLLIDLSKALECSPLYLLGLIEEPTQEDLQGELDRLKAENKKLQAIIDNMIKK